jgi:hypothetical protein
MKNQRVGKSECGMGIAECGMKNKRLGKSECRMRIAECGMNDPKG